MPLKNGKLIVPLLAVAALLSRDQAGDRERRAAAISWLTANAIRLTTTSPGHGVDDMEPLGALIGTAHVVALGEANHGAHEIFTLKHRMLEFLVTRMGFTVFAMEGSMSEGFDVNDYVLTGRGDPAKALAALYYWNWNTDEVLDLVEWIRRYNADSRHTRKVKFYGFDMTAPPRPVRLVRDYLRRVDRPAAEGWEAALANWANFLRPGTFRDVAAVERDSMLRAVQAQLTRFDDQRAEYVGRSSETEWATARQHVRMLLPYLGPAGIRDRAMAENVAWILEREGPESKAVLWAHNSHVADNCTSPGVGSMGCYLRQRFGRELLIVGSVFDRGGFNANDGLGIGSTLRSFEVAPAAIGTVEGTLAEAGLSVAGVDLRAIPDGPVAEWFGVPRMTRTFGNVFRSGALNPGFVSQPVRAFYDALLFVDGTSPSKLRPEAAWPTRELLPVPANLGFEERSADGRPRYWNVTPSIGAFNHVDFEFKVTTSSDYAFRGGWSAAVTRTSSERQYGETNGGLEQVVDAGPYRGKWVRLRAMSRIQADLGIGRAHLWVGLVPESHTDLGFRISGVRQVDGDAWRSYEVTVFVPAEVVGIRFGLALTGYGRAWMDDVSIDTVPPPR